MSTGAGVTRSNDVAERVADAYVWGLPVLLTHRTRAAHAVSAPAGGLVVRDRLSTAADRSVVAPNNDTLYASGWYDLRAGDLTVTVDAARLGDRYWSVMLLDAHTHVQYVTRRTFAPTTRVTYAPARPVASAGPGVARMGT